MLAKSKGNKHPLAKSLFWLVKTFKFLTYFVLIAVLLTQIHNGITKLGGNQMTYTSSTTVEEPITYPTVSLCITMDTNFTGGWSNQNWLDPEKYNFSFPFEDLGHVLDAFIDG